MDSRGTSPYTSLSPGLESFYPAPLPSTRPQNGSNGTQSQEYNGESPLVTRPSASQATPATSQTTAAAAASVAALQQLASSSQPKIRRRNRMITSCLECRRRKLKCDKSHPCTNCTKFNRDCVFLAPNLDSASQLKLTEIKEKMGSLERVLEQDVARAAALQAQGGLATIKDEVEFAPEPEDEKQLEATPLSVVDAVYDDDADGDFLDLGVRFGKLRLTDRLGGYFRPKISEELHVTLADNGRDRRVAEEKAQSAVPALPPSYAMLKGDGASRDFMAPGPSYIPPSANFMFGSGTITTESLLKFLPNRQAGGYLLQHYWYAVHPICRTVHRPSFERRFEQFWQEVSQNIEPVASLQAVVFSMMFSSVASMPEDMVLRFFGVSKKDLQENFQQGAEAALARANLLRTTKIETMQAFIMYLIPLCRDQISRAHSALVGMAIRLAECMGLHRDGSQYGLTPVETHVRRVIWHQICFLDLRTCEAQGPRPTIRESEFDTKFPLNINDDELENSRGPLKDSKEWTDMTISLIRMECNEMHRVIWVDRPRLEKKQITITALLGKAENFKRIMLEKYLPMLKQGTPLQRLAGQTMNVLMYRMYIMILHRYHNGVAFKIPDRLRQIIITSGVQTCEAAVNLEVDPVLRPWSWYAGAYQQHQVAFLLLAEIYAYPMRKEADRIWAVLDYVFEPPLHLSRQNKARTILTEIKDRMGVYSNARKLRAPTAMVQRLKPADNVPDQLRMFPQQRYPPPSPGQTPPYMVPVSSPRPSVSSLEEGSAPHYAPMAGYGSNNSGNNNPPGDAAIAAGVGDNQMLPPAPMGAGLAGGAGMPVGLMSPDMNMAMQPSPQSFTIEEFDWNEFDQWFPPDVVTGDLNMPMGES